MITALHRDYNNLIHLTRDPISGVWLNRTSDGEQGLISDAQLAAHYKIVDPLELIAYPYYAKSRSSGLGTAFSKGIEPSGYLLIDPSRPGADEAVEFIGEEYREAAKRNHDCRQWYVVSDWFSAERTESTCAGPPDAVKAALDLVAHPINPQSPSQTTGLPGLA